MSYDRLPSLEAQPTTTRREDDPQYTDDPEFRNLTQNLSSQLFTLTSNISKLSTQIALLGTKRDTERVRERVHDLLEETQNGFKRVGEGVKKVQAWDDVNPHQRYIQQKLFREFQASLSEFQTVQRSALEKQRSSARAARTAVEEGGHQQSDQPLSPSAGQQQQQQQEQDQIRLAPQDEVDFQESLIIERESEIRHIEQSVGELNELFRDVAHIVTEQGEQLDLIADNVENVRNDTHGADRELRSASNYQKNARNKACCLLLILAVVLTVVLLAVFLG
ncbi:MAG: hypothetical protein M1823_000609 [Watsoniomyces obsoletus]|nr:MAG: hypothetical protein M1823_000609 [Watsoniomyces obsoletus]